MLKLEGETISREPIPLVGVSALIFGVNKIQIIYREHKHKNNTNVDSKKNQSPLSTRNKNKNQIYY